MMEHARHRLAWASQRWSVCDQVTGETNPKNGLRSCLTEREELWVGQVKIARTALSVLYSPRTPCKEFGERRGVSPMPGT